MAEPDLQQLAPSLYRLRIPGGRAHRLNCYLCTDDDGVTLVDTGWPDSAGLIADAVRALGRRRRDVTRVVLTHFHEDHCGSAQEIASWSPEVEVVAGERDAAFVRGDLAGPHPVLTRLEESIRPGDEWSLHGPPCRVDRVVRDGDVLDFGGGARVLEVPGHTAGSIALHLPALDTVLTGDAVAEFNGQVILGVFNVDRQAAAESMKRIAATGAGNAGFGHGEAALGGAADRIAAAVDPFADGPAGG